LLCIDGRSRLLSENLTGRIAELKAKRNAVILAHNYQRGEVQDIADFVGDSLELARKAAGTDADVIVFCGVHFMAEMAAIVNPGRIVLVPDPNAGCPMANMINVRQLRNLKSQHPDAAVVCYVNSSAAVKAESDVCCTSANAPDIIGSFPQEREVIFVPDKSLGGWAARKLGRDNVILWDGYCPTHHRILARDIRERKAEHPGAKVAVHPECTEDVIELADAVASTTGILRFACESGASEVIMGTEVGMLHRIRRECPRVKVYAASPLADCPNMKLNTLEKVAWSLEDMDCRVAVDPAVAQGARRSIEKMLEITP
jgi:quinolinate synthase